MTEREIATITVLGSQAVARADGSVAIVLTTLEEGPIAFAVHLQAIEALQRDLANLRQILLSQTGIAQ